MSKTSIIIIFVLVIIIIVYGILIYLSNEQSAIFTGQSNEITVGPKKSNKIDKSIPFNLSLDDIQPSIIVTSPNDGEIWNIGEEHLITMEVIGNGVNIIDIELWEGEEYKFRISRQNIFGNRSVTYNFRIPEKYKYDYRNIPYTYPKYSYSILKSSNNYKIKAQLISGRKGDIIAIDFSDAPFSIISTSSLPNIVINPKGGEEWEIGKNYEIRWDKTFFPYNEVTVAIIPQIIEEGDKFYERKISSLNTGNFMWRVDVKPGLYKISVYQEGSDAPPTNPFFRKIVPYVNSSDWLRINSPSVKLHGDSNLDGIVNCQDLRHIFDVFFGAGYNLYNSDYNNDGEINLFDDIKFLKRDLQIQGVMCFAIDSISPSSGRAGTEITLTGVGLDFPFPGEFSEPFLHFGERIIDMYMWEEKTNNAIRFKIPTKICPHGTANIGACLEEEITIIPGVYGIYLSNTLGDSNTVKFIVTP